MSDFPESNECDKQQERFLNLILKITDEMLMQQEAIKASLRVQQIQLEQLRVHVEIAKKDVPHKTIECDKGLKINTDRLNRGIYYDGLE